MKLSNINQLAGLVHQRRAIQAALGKCTTSWTNRWKLVGWYRADGRPDGEEVECEIPMEDAKEDLENLLAEVEKKIQHLGVEIDV